jgi:carnitine O-acetyltransferase
MWTLTPSIRVGIRYAETRLSDLKGYLLEAQRILIQLHRSANERPAPFVDHAGILCDSKTGRPISNGHGYASDESGSDYEDTMRESFGCAQLFVSLLVLVFLAGYSFFDSGDIDLLGRRK